MAVAAMGVLRGVCRGRGETGLMACRSVDENGICEVVVAVKGR